MARLKAPKYRKHKNGSGYTKGFVQYKGKRYYFRGDYGSEESLDSYNKFVAKYFSGELQKLFEPVSLAKSKIKTVAGIINEFLKWAKIRYSRSALENRGEYFNCKHALLPLAVKRGKEDASEWAPADLRKWRDHLIDLDHSRNYINSEIGRIKRMFVWASERGLIPETTALAISAVKGLKRGREGVRETKKKKPVAWEHVEPVIKEVNKVVSAMIQVQWHTGVRSDSICNAKPEQFVRDKNLGVLVWKPKHKTEYLGVELQIPIGPLCESIILPFIGATKKGKYLFSSGASDGSRSKRGKYGTRSYAHAIERSIKRINDDIKNECDKIPHWSPHQMRHAKGHAVRSKYGLEGVQAALGHESIKTSQIYSGMPFDLAVKIAKETG